METYSALLVLCAGNSPVTGEVPARRPVTRSFDAFVDPKWPLFGLNIDPYSCRRLEYGSMFRPNKGHFGLAVVSYHAEEPGCYWFNSWYVAYSVPRHYLNQCWFVVNCITAKTCIEIGIMIKKTSTIGIRKCRLQNFFRPQCVNFIAMAIAATRLNPIESDRSARRCSYTD